MLFFTCSSSVAVSSANNPLNVTVSSCSTIS